MGDREYLTVRQAAEYSTLSQPHLRRDIAAGRLRVRRIGRRVIVAVSDLDAYLAGKPNEVRRVPPPPV